MEPNNPAQQPCISLQQSRTNVPLNCDPCAHINYEPSAPPADEEANHPNVPPPSYDTLFGPVRETSKTSTGICDFFIKIFILLLGGIGITVLLGLGFGVQIAMIIIGVLYFYDCPINGFIPVYLIVGGTVGILRQLLDLDAVCKKRTETSEDVEGDSKKSPMKTLVCCFMLGWFVIGSVWVYKEYEPNYDPSRGKYCNETLYLFSFWLTTAVYIFFSTATICLYFC